jgi:hypothetical protein
MRLQRHCHATTGMSLSCLKKHLHQPTNTTTPSNTLVVSHVYTFAIYFLYPSLIPFYSIIFCIVLYMSQSTPYIVHFSNLLNIITKRCNSLFPPHNHKGNMYFCFWWRVKMKHYIFLLGKHHLYYTLDFKESLKIEDLPEANTNKQSKLTQ